LFFGWYDPPQLTHPTDPPSRGILPQYGLGLFFFFDFRWGTRVTVLVVHFSPEPLTLSYLEKDPIAFPPLRDEFLVMAMAELEKVQSTKSKGI